MKKSDFIFSIAAIMMSVFCLTSCKEGGVVEPVPEPEPEPEVITFEVTPSVESLVFEAARPEVYEFAVETNDSTWEVTSDAEWCVIAQSETGFTVTAEPSVSFEPMTPGTVTIKSSDTTYATFAVEQNELKMWFGGSEDGWATIWHNGEKSLLEAANINDIHVEADGTMHIVGYNSAGMGGSEGWYWSEATGFSYVQTVSGSSQMCSSVTMDESAGDVYYSSYEYWSEYDEELGYPVNQFLASYWKNLEQNVVVESGYAEAGTVAVEDGNVYITVEDNGVPCYYKNGERHEIDDFGSTQVELASMIVKDGNVYISGFYLDVDKFVACWWVNGEGYDIPSDVSINVYGIDVDDEGNVYIVGSEGLGLNRKAVYWKNGEMISLTDYGNAVASIIYVIGDHVLCAGIEREEGMSNYIIKYWLDGQETSLTDGSTNAALGSLFIR